MDTSELLYCFSPSILLTRSFDCTEPLARRMPIAPSIVPKRSFDSTESPSPQRLHGEPSLSQRRGLANSITSLRQLVEFKGAVQLIRTCDWLPPSKRFSKSFIALYQKQKTSWGVKPLRSLMIFISKLLLHESPCPCTSHLAQ